MDERSLSIFHRSSWCAVVGFTDCTGPIAEEFFRLVEWTRNDMNTDEFAYSPSRNRPCFSCRFNGTNVAPDQDGHVTIEQILFTDQLHIRGFYHGIGSLHSSNKTARLYHPESFVLHIDAANPARNVTET